MAPKAACKRSMYLDVFPEVAMNIDRPATRKAQKAE
jgi:hypothetical protein